MLSLSLFDRIVLIVLMGLVSAIVAIIASGDRVGIRLIYFSPTDEAHSTDSLVIRFSEPMNHDSVVQHLHVEPPIQGNFTWNGLTMVFRPSPSLLPGIAYTVRLTHGAKSLTNRETLSDFEFSFRVRSSRLAYLAPADGKTPVNIWMADVDNPSRAQQLTFSQSGIISFDVSPDGSRIAFSEKHSRGLSDIWLLDLATKRLQQLTNCSDSACSMPIWKPDGTAIAYARSFINADLNGSFNVGAGFRGGLPRVWLADLTANAARPLFADSQIIGQPLGWSNDGNRIAFFDLNSGDTSVYDFTENRTVVIANPYGSPGSLSPNGKQVVFAKFIQVGQTRAVQLHLQIEDLATEQIHDFSNAATGQLSDSNPIWHPDGQSILFTRKYLDNREAQGAQIYLLNLQDGSFKPLIADPQYTTNSLIWDAAGEQLLLLRFKIASLNGQPPKTPPEIWSYHRTTGKLTQMKTNAFFPRWIP